MVKSLVLVLVILIGGGSSNIIAYSSPDGDPFYVDNYAMNEEFYVVSKPIENPKPEPMTYNPCTALQQAVCYKDWIASGYYY